MTSMGGPDYEMVYITPHTSRQACQELSTADTTAYQPTTFVWRNHTTNLPWPTLCVLNPLLEHTRTHPCLDQPKMHVSVEYFGWLHPMLRVIATPHSQPAVQSQLNRALPTAQLGICLHNASDRLILATQSTSIAPSFESGTVRNRHLLAA